MGAMGYNSTTTTMLQNEAVKEIARVFDANAEKQNSLTKVFETTCAALRKDKITGVLYADLLGSASGNAEQKAARAEFLRRFFEQMPHIVYNGTDKVVPCDFVQVQPNDEKGMHKAIKQYRIEGGEIVRPEGCVGMIAIEKDVPVTIEYKHESGYVEFIAKKDDKGKAITKKQTLNFVPREKAIWGYTKTVKNAIIAALATYFAE